MAPPLRRSVSIGPLQVSPLCLGLVSDPDTVIAAWDAGINFFFVTTDMHWPLYEGLREGLRRLAIARPQALDEAVIAGCTYVAQREFLHAPFTELLDAIKPYRKIDLAIAGGSYAADLDPRVAQLKANIAAGVCGATAVGASVHDRPAGVEAVNRDKVDVLFVRYNPGHPGARFDFFPKLKPGRRTKIFNFKSTYSYRPPETYLKLGLDPETWLPPRTDYYRFVLGQRDVDGILCALRDPSEVESLVDALAAGPLPVEEEGHLLMLAGMLLKADGPM